MNNEQNSTLSPTWTGGDFFGYSGVIRPIVVTELSPTAPYFISRVEPIILDAHAGRLDLRVVLGTVNASALLPPTVHLAVGFNGGAPGAAGEYGVLEAPWGGEHVAVIPGVQAPAGTPLWQLGIGGTFEVSVTAPIVGDTLSIRTGLRVLGVDAATGRLTINGVVEKLVGYNRHTLRFDTGAALTPAQEAAGESGWGGVGAAAMGLLS